MVLSVAVQLESRRAGAGRKLARSLAPADTSRKTLDRLNDLVTNPPRARWSSAPVLLLFGRYIRETSLALSTGSLPDIPIRVLVPRTRSGISTAAAPD